MMNAMRCGYALCAALLLVRVINGQSPSGSPFALVPYTVSTSNGQCSDVFGFALDAGLSTIAQSSAASGTVGTRVCATPHTSDAHRDGMLLILLDHGWLWLLQL